MAIKPSSHSNPRAQRQDTAQCGVSSESGAFTATEVAPASENVGGIRPFEGPRGFPLNKKCCSVLSGAQHNSARKPVRHTSLEGAIGRNALARSLQINQTTMLMKPTRTPNLSCNSNQSSGKSNPKQHNRQLQKIPKQFGAQPPAQKDITPQNNPEAQSPTPKDIVNQKILKAQSPTQVRVPKCEGPTDIQDSKKNELPRSFQSESKK